MLGGRVLRARTPAGIEQEVYALLVTYQLLRTAIADATAACTGLDPDRIQNTIDTMDQLGILENGAPPLDRLLDTGPATAAIKQLGERAGSRR